jgi:20S proteasome subunit beta 3
MLLLLTSASNSFHGGSFLALAGKDAVVLASDAKFLSGGQYIGTFPRDVFRVGSKTLLGLDGLELSANQFVHSLHPQLLGLTDEDLGPTNIAQLVSNSLIRQLAFVSPIIAGLEENGECFVCSMDQIGATTKSNSYAATGTATSGLLSLCESLYVPALSAPKLVELAEKCMRQAFQRDILSGSRIKIVTLRRSEIYVKEMEFRNI